MNRFFAVVFSIVLLNCSGKDNNSKIASKKIEVQQNRYEKLNNNSNVISNEILSIAQFKNIQMPLNFVFFKESEKTFLNIYNIYLQITWLYKIDNN